MWLAVVILILSLAFFVFMSALVLLRAWQEAKKRQIKNLRAAAENETPSGFD